MRAEQVYDYYGIIPDGNEPIVLMRETPDGWELPHFETTAPHYWPDVRHVNETFGAQFGLDLTTLRCINTKFEPYTNRGRRVYDMENHSSNGQTPPGFTWIDREQLLGLSLAVPQHGSFLEVWFDEAESGDYPEFRPPWAHKGWYDGALRWVTEHLAGQGISITGRPVQLRAWERSFLLRVPASGVDYYFKALPPAFAHEPPLTAALAEWHPGSFPQVQALDVEKRYMLMPDFGGARLDASPEIEVWEDAFRTFARLQIDLASRTEQLDKLGCPWRPLYWLADQLDSLLEDTDALASPNQGLSMGEIEQLRELSPRLKEMCEQLTFYRVPFSLEHGDLFAENIAITPSGFLYYDWSDASISHPFFSMLVVYSDAGSELPRVPNAHERLRNAYLEPWQVFEPMDRLIEAFDVSQVLGGVHAALGYYLNILPGMAEKWEMEDMVPFYLRMALRNAAFTA